MWSKFVILIIELICANYEDYPRVIDCELVHAELVGLVYRLSVLQHAVRYCVSLSRASHAANVTVPAEVIHESREMLLHPLSS